MQFQSQNKEEENIPSPKKIYTYEDLLKFENTGYLSSMGKMKLSQKTSEPAYTFGTSTRKHFEKQYVSNELSKGQMLGRTSAGPNYEVRHTDVYYYKHEPRYSIGNQERKTFQNNSMYAHYNRVDVDFDPVAADNSRKNKSPGVRIGLSQRFEGNKRSRTPGPEYDPSLKPEIPRAPRYSMGSRRAIAGYDPLVIQNATPAQVGPGAYRKLDEKNTSLIEDAPNYSFTKEEKFRNAPKSVSKHQTYDVTPSIGPQILSKKPTGPQISLPKARKDTRIGIFKQHMSTQPVKLRLPHANY